MNVIRREPDGVRIVLDAERLLVPADIARNKFLPDYRLTIPLLFGELVGYSGHIFHFNHKGNAFCRAH